MISRPLRRGGIGSPAGGFSESLIVPNHTRRGAPLPRLTPPVAGARTDVTAGARNRKSPRNSLKVAAGTVDQKGVGGGGRVQVRRGATDVPADARVERETTATRREAARAGTMEIL